MKQTLPRPSARSNGTLLHFPHKQDARDGLVLWHLLSLDAPTVAALWVVFVARSAHVALPWISPACMFLAVWMLYVADRLLDARDVSDSGRRSELEERHRFHHRHRSRFMLVLAGVAVLLACLAPRLDAGAMHLYAALAALLAAYFFLIHMTLHSSQRLPKELAVGVFFAAAIFIPTVARAPALRPTLLPCAVMFAATCTLNCLYLYLWEHPLNRTAAHRTTQFATAHLHAITLPLLILELVMAVCFTHGRAITLACALSTALLFLLHRLRKTLSPLHLRAAADLALLTPATLLPLLR